MEPEELHKNIIALFNKILKSTVSLENPPFGANSLNGAISKFVPIFSKRDSGITWGRVVDFIISSCYRYREWERWRGRIIPSWYFGDKAIEKFFTQKKGVMYYENLWLEDNDLNREDLKNMFMSVKGEHPFRKFIYLPSEEVTKKRFHNQKTGYQLCLSSTMMWSPKSEACQKCNFIEECKKVLRESIPELYRLREET